MKLRTEDPPPGRRVPQVPNFNFRKNTDDHVSRGTKNITAENR